MKIKNEAEVRRAYSLRECKVEDGYVVKINMDNGIHHLCVMLDYLGSKKVFRIEMNVYEDGASEPVETPTFCQCNISYNLFLLIINEYISDCCLYMSDKINLNKIMQNGYEKYQFSFDNKNDTTILWKSDMTIMLHVHDDPEVGIEVYCRDSGNMVEILQLLDEYNTMYQNGKHLSEHEFGDYTSSATYAWEYALNRCLAEEGRK